jgi:hypothetical protein
MALGTMGCWQFNETYTNDSDTPRMIKVFVKFDSQMALFPGVAEWYEGHGAMISPQNDGSWELKFPQVVQPHGSIHVGFNFQDDNVKFKHAYGQWCPIRVNGEGETTTFAAVQLSTALVAEQGLVLQVGVDPTAPGPITVSRLDWTATDSALPLSSLIFGNPDFEAQPWRAVTAELPFTLTPGDPPKVFDAPDAELVGLDFGLVRYVAVAQGVSQEGVYESRLAGGVSAIPAVGAWGAALCALLIAAWAWFLLRSVRWA